MPLSPTPAFWVENRAAQIQGLDLLGLRQAAQRFGVEALSGVATVTPAVRYFSLRTWIIDSFRKLQTPNTSDELYRFAEAKREFSLASDIEPGCKPIALANTVLLHCEEGRYETARKVADVLAQEYPDEHAVALLGARLSMYTPSITRREEYERSVSVWDTKSEDIEPLPYSQPRDPLSNRKVKIGYFSAAKDCERRLQLV